jgi:hypothetical protein
MIEIPGSKAKFIGARNYLSIEPALDDYELWCHWFVEGENFEYTKVIHPLTTPAIA